MQDIGGGATLLRLTKLLEMMPRASESNALENWEEVER